MKIITTRKTIIKEFAAKLADIHRRADHEYYKPFLNNYTPEPNKNEHAAWLLDQRIPINDMCNKLGITKQVYEEAYKIYDFRNSGKKGYKLKEGKIQKVGLSA